MNPNKTRQSNLKILGIYLRYHRLQQNHTLRSLAQVANISHTMISNIETGTVEANNETLRSLFQAMDLNFYDTNEAPHDFYMYYAKIYDALYYCRYKEAKLLIDDLEAATNIYEHSIFVIDYQLIRLLYYNLTDTSDVNMEKMITYYTPLVSFFTDTQKNLFHFIKGLHHLNYQQFHQAMLEFETALEIGSFELELVIKEYYIRVLARTYKWVDAMLIGKQTISELESKTNYIRAMHIRLQIGYVNVIIKKFDDAKPLFERVLHLGHQYNIPHLVHQAHEYLAFMNLRLQRFDKVEEYLDLLPPHFSADQDIISLYIAMQTKSDNIKELYEHALSNPKIKKNKTFQLIVDIAYLSWMKPSSKEYKTKLEELTQLTKETNDQEIMDSTHKMLMEYYQEKRQYKKAFETAKQLLHYKELGV